MLKPLLYVSESVGKYIKRSKTKHTWVFEINGQEHTIELYISHISRRAAILYDGDLKFNGKIQKQRYEEYQIPTNEGLIIVYKLEKNLLDVRIGCTSFTVLQQKQAFIEKQSNSIIANQVVGLPREELTPISFNRIQLSRSLCPISNNNQYEKKKNFEAVFNTLKFPHSA